MDGFFLSQGYVWKILQRLAAALVVAAVLPVAPAAAAIKVTFAGYFDDPTYSGDYPAEYDFEYSYFYRPQAIEYSCVEDFFAYCDRETVPLIAASGRIGDTSIPYHSITGRAAAEYDDPVAFSFRQDGGYYPYIAGSFVNYGWWLSATSTSFGGVGPDYLQVFSPDGAATQRAYLFSMTTTAVPEPATWLMLLTGFSTVGAAVRRSRRQTVRVRYA